jgi:hypothetical protein
MRRGPSAGADRILTSHLRLQTVLTMRDFKGMKRQRGRNRGGGSGASGGGGKPQQHNANRAFESNGPDNLKIRGHAQHVFEKYQQLARDATSAGDRVLGESLLQHAEHYFRVLRTLQPNRPYTDFIGREGFASGYDIDFEDEMGEGEEGETTAEGVEAQPSDERGDYQARDGQNRESQNRESQNRDGQNRDGQNRDAQNRDGQNRDGQPREQRWDNRNDQNRSDNNRQDGRSDRGYNNNGANNGANRNRDRSFNRDQPRDQPRDDRNFNRDQPRDAARDQPRDQPRDRGEGRWENRGEGQDGESGRYERRDRSYEARDPQRDPLPVVEPQAAPLTREPQPVETRAPARETASPDAPARAPRVLRSSDGEESHAPAFLQSAASTTPAASGEADAPVKRPRGRPKKKVEETAPEEA